MRSTIVLATLAALFILPASLGAEEDASALLRRAGVAESVDRDPAKAVELYRRALEAGGTSDTARDAALALARLLEEREEASGALDALRLLTERFSARLDEDDKRRVHEALVRLLPPGSRARSPLGDVYVVAAGGRIDAASPLERKIAKLLEPLDDTTGMTQQARDTVWYQVRKAVAPVAKEALPILERIMLEGSPAHASVAADLFADRGQGRAVTGLVRAIREGDSFTQEAALTALYKIRSTDPEVSRLLVSGLEDLDPEALSTNQRARIRYILANHLEPAELLRRFEAGDDPQLEFISRALRAKTPGALQAAFDEMERDPETAPRLSSIVAAAVAGSSVNRPSFPADSLDSEQLKLLLTALASRPGDASFVAVVLLARMLDERDDPATGEWARATAWRLIATVKDDRRSWLVRWLVGYDRPRWSKGPAAALVPPVTLFEDDAWSGHFFREIWQFAKGNDNGLAESGLGRDPRFWRAAIAVGGTLETDRDAADLAKLLERHLVDDLPPPELDADWIPLLAREPWSDTPPEFMLHAAARSGRTEFLGLVRALTIGRGWKFVDFRLVISALLGHYRGPGLEAVTAELVRDAEKVLRSDESLGAYMGGFLCELIAGQGGAEARPALLRIATDWSAPTSAIRCALHRLRDDREAVLAVLDAAARADEIPGGDYVHKQLIDLAVRHRLQEAAPFLLREYRSARFSDEAGKAMDTIRTYHERLTSFEAWVKGERGPKAKRLADLLEDEDPEIRRAAALALGALGLSEALPTLVGIAKDDPDPRVREAALSAVERITE